MTNDEYRINELTYEKSKLTKENRKLRRELTALRATASRVALFKHELAAATAQGEAARRTLDAFEQFASGHTAEVVAARLPNLFDVLRALSRPTEETGNG